jgi:hypothetical protein
MKNQANLLDKRLIQKSLTRGHIAQTEYDEYLKNLPDLEDECEELVLDAAENEDEPEVDTEDEAASESEPPAPV